MRSSIFRLNRLIWRRWRGEVGRREGGGEEGRRKVEGGGRREGRGGWRRKREERKLEAVEGNREEK